MSEEQAEYIVNGRPAKMPFECEVCGGKHPTLQQARDCEQACKEHCRKRRIEREVGGRICTCDVCMANGQGNAEVTEDICPTLNCNHEQPIYFEPRFTRISSGLSNASGVAATLTGGHGGTGDGTPHIAGVKWGVRRLTPMECERLQGFPEDWAATLSDAQRYKALGNAVTVNVAEWIAKRLIKEM